MNYYLVPTEQAVVIPNLPAATVPKYWDNLVGLDWAIVPFGIEGIALLSLAAPNAALAAESDVFAFPSDLTALLTGADVSKLSAYCGNYKIPSKWVAKGMPWAVVLRQLATVFLTAQFVSARTGASIFAN